jgi:hypothetical protein
MTVYSVRIHAGIGSSETEERAAARNPDIGSRSASVTSSQPTVLRCHLITIFDSNKSCKNGFTKLVEWDSNATRVLNNVDLDPKNFEIN